VPDDVGVGWPPGFADGPRGSRALLTLSCLRGITPRALFKLAWAEGTAAASLRAILRGRAGSASDRSWAPEIDPDEVMDKLKHCSARFLANGDPEYPAELNDLLADPPGWLFVRGQRLRAGELRVAVVGSRICSSAGRDIAFDLGRHLAGAGVAVVSGAANGIDAASHRGALAAPGPTVAVLGSGIDVFYPPSKREMLARIEAAGTVISEYPPGTAAEPRHFPARNRIIAALSAAMVVVEGAGKSGSRISVDHALDLGRDVFAIPGPVTSPLSETPLELIREGATMIRGADDLLADLGVAARIAFEPPPDLPPDERRIFETLIEPALPDAVARRADLSIPQAITALLGLELRGLVRVLGGRYERRLASAASSAEARE
jgi:DNA processing protein